MIDPEMRKCIDACTRCHAVCVETLQRCLSKGGRHAEIGHVRTMMDCAQVCATSADFMLRNSELHAYTCGACASVCDACARSCEEMADDDMMKHCAEVCRQCAEECRKMSQSGKPGKAA